ncbi:MAG: sugar ABC transporter ATP-binding protein [Eubacteriales bacterium]|nr:sugar ABC transporter ATP-binding protein [Eubacteriales bacterium]
MKDTQQAFLVARNLSKSFAGNQVLTDASLSLQPGQYHGLVGENGAGKSTFINLITGIYQHDGGEIIVDGKTYDHLTPLLAKQLGILSVHQELSINPTLTVTQNIFLGCEILKGAFLDTREMKRLTVSLLADVGLSHIDPDQDAGELTMAERQMLEFAKAMFQRPRLLVLDEATSALDDAQVAIVFQKLRELKKQNMMLIFISHRLHEITDICDTMTVMKDGQIMATKNVCEYDEDGIVSLMTGRSVSSQFPPKPDAREVLARPKVVEAEHLAFSKTRDASFCLHKGEILGIGGLQGQGQQSFLEVLFGVKRVNRGTLQLDGKPITLSSPSAAMRNGIAYLPAERKVDGLFVTHPIRFNMSFAGLNLVCNRLGIIRSKKEDKLCEDAKERFSIKLRSFRQLASELSGGNQQKVAIAKWLSRNPRLLLLNEPTRGIDVGTKHEIYQLMHDLAEQGVSIVMISSDTIELLNMCSRVLTIYENEINAELIGDEITEESLVKASVFRKEAV